MFALLMLSAVPPVKAAALGRRAVVELAALGRAVEVVVVIVVVVVDAEFGGCR